MKNKDICGKLRKGANFAAANLPLRPKKKKHDDRLKSTLHRKFSRKLLYHNNAVIKRKPGRLVVKCAQFWPNKKKILRSEAGQQLSQNLLCLTIVLFFRTQVGTTKSLRKILPTIRGQENQNSIQYNHAWGSNQSGVVRDIGGSK